MDTSGSASQQCHTSAVSFWEGALSISFTGKNEGNNVYFSRLLCGLEVKKIKTNRKTKQKKPTTPSM